MLPAKRRFSPIVLLICCSALLAACSGTNSQGEPAVPSSPGGSPAAHASPSDARSPSNTSTTSPSVNPSPGASTSSPSGTAAAPGTVKPRSTDKPVPPASDSDLKKLSWYYTKKKKGEVPGFPPETKRFDSGRKAVWVGTGKKVYLTFDTGGPLGESDKLLQILKDNNVKAAFFLVGYNVKEHKDFTRKVAEAGHLIGNHTMTHKDMTTLTDDQVKKEINDFAQLIKDVTGKPPAPVFRFPYGFYSMHLLKTVSDLGYTSVFWSTAMKDWEPRKNGAEDPYNDIMNGLHDGDIILMHQGSQENIEALDRIIKDVKKQGYEFGRLDELVR